MHTNSVQELPPNRIRGNMNPYRRQQTAALYFICWHVFKDVGHLINTGSFASQPTLIIHNNFASIQSSSSRSRWTWGLWHRSEAAWLLGSRVRIPPGSWMFPLVFVVWRVGSGLCDRLITGVEESYRMCVYNRPQQLGILGLSWAVAPQK